jgi:transcriptional regulator with XRE-family HTH domain
LQIAASQSTVGRRNVRGLRREEVAEIAEIGTSWYAMLEQGRVENVSMRTIAAVARALQLSEAESQHVFTLAAASFHELSPNFTPPPAALVAYIQRATLGMAFIVSSEFDVVAFNPEADRFFRFSEHGARPNLVNIMLEDPRMREQFIDPCWQDVLDQMIGHLRLSYGRVGGAGFQTLLARLSVFPEFSASWDAHLVKPPPAERSLLNVPHDGTRLFNVRAFSSFMSPTYTIVFKTPVVDTMVRGAGGTERRQTGEVKPSQPGSFDEWRRVDLGAFLRQRRERTRPEDIGLAVGGRRHAKGLRREEVAQRAGIGVSWYTMLEQGHVENLTLRTLRAVADALDLTHRERLYLERLTLQSFSEFSNFGRTAGQDLLNLVRSFSDGHAHLHDADFNMLSWNRDAEEFYGFSSWPSPNLLEVMVRNSRLRDQFAGPSWEEALRRLVAQYRFNHVLFNDAQSDAMIAALAHESPEFAAIWAGDRTVQVPAAEWVRLLYPTSGPRQVHVLLLSPADLPTHTLVLKIASGHSPVESSQP